MNNSSPPFVFDNYQVEDSVGYLLARSKTMLSKSINESLAQLGITAAQGSVFMMLAMGKCNTAADLARDLFIDSAAMKRMVDRLESKGLMERIPDMHDKRLFKLELTDTGKELVQKLPAIYTDVLNVGFTGFSAEEIGFLKSLLRKLLANRSLLESKSTN
ncbi:MarR family winged helix-turn-helix transcriptional regulator [Undibacterium sp.]|jgi:DNA-binding MarR family transcriptional regulator|uniref:MarR family winged helix-turn-helix transcriptional regulator n=1 Tax=Undibacterium sp. TaxID=1914977 RepID=UPI002BCDDC56|nr:MarR family winged helix-turn-helix transcriptional regulator [Undibacterium sp.]HTD03194.1 MarR family winged helix-turn-helix transcriptional regulator [Undibacterium sp.]